VAALVQLAAGVEVFDARARGQGRLEELPRRAAPDLQLERDLEEQLLVGEDGLGMSAQGRLGRDGHDQQPGTVLRGLVDQLLQQRRAVAVGNAPDASDADPVLGGPQAQLAALLLAQGPVLAAEDVDHEDAGLDQAHLLQQAGGVVLTPVRERAPAVVVDALRVGAAAVGGARFLLARERAEHEVRVVGAHLLAPALEPLAQRGALDRRAEDLDLRPVRLERLAQQRRPGVLAREERPEGLVGAQDRDAQDPARALARSLLAAEAGGIEVLTRDPGHFGSRHRPPDLAGIALVEAVPAQPGIALGTPDHGRSGAGGVVEGRAAQRDLAQAGAAEEQRQCECNGSPRRGLEGHECARIAPEIRREGPGKIAKNPRVGEPKAVKNAAPLPALALALAACAATGRAPSQPMDIHSHAQPQLVRVTHASLDLTLDFERHEARGQVRLDLDRRDPSAALVLDAQALEIERVAGSDGGARSFRLGAPDPNLGSALSIALAPLDRSVTVHYRTTKDTQALQWLAPEQTHDKRQPYLFTQGQAILTRTWIPLQDTPGVRITYDAAIRCPAGLTPVMSAEQLGLSEDGAHRFRMPQAIPSYLIALACGELAFRPISERCGIWAEPGQVAQARREFEDTEKMVQAAEQLFGPYRWGRYDLLILPPSFPFGGMENPRLTFATPTVLAGDKSLVSLVAHELAHSWSGNLVTNATWRDFWLNEGFTVYFESRIMEAVYGPERARMERQLAIGELERGLKELEPWQQVLHVKLEGRHPDEGFSDVPYTKGALFLTRLEELCGRARFDAFLRKWFDEHAFQSVTTEDFRAFLQRELPEAAPPAIDLEAWLEKPGIPADAPRPETESLARVDREVARWKAAQDPAAPASDGWVTQQWLHFLEGIVPGLDAQGMAVLDARFGFTRTGNCEILDVWLRLAIQCGYSAADARLEEFLMDVGRRKYLEPLYKELRKTPAGLERAKVLYARARPRYHAVSAGTIDELLGWKRDG
jgi:hypothetical protein